MIPTYNEIIDLIKKGANLEAEEKIAELRNAVIILEDDKHNLTQQIRELRQRLEIKETAIFKESVYWILKDGTEDGPFCQRCYDVDGKLVRLQRHSMGVGFICRECKSNY